MNRFGHIAIAAAILLDGRFAAAEEEVRIILDSDAKSVLLAGEGLALFDARDGRKVWSFGGRGSTRVTGSGSLLEARSQKGRDRYGTAPGFYVEADGPVEVEGKPFLGRVQLLGSGGNRLTVLNRLPVEIYLLGTVGSEMPPTWPLEALKAQAVAARTYALQRLMIARAANRVYDLGATVLSQVYNGADSIHPSVKAAVQATRGEVLGYERTLIEALFHSTCGGSTVSSEDFFEGRKDYLRGRKCDWCKGSEFYRWERRERLASAGAKLQKAKLISGPLELAWRNPDDKEVKVRVKGRTYKLSMAKFRRALRLDMRSGRFSVSTKDGFVEVVGRGFGHGVGMCQWGARGMAEAGFNYQEILGHYYKGAKVRRLY